MNTTVIGYRVFSMMRAKKMVKDDLTKKGINLRTVTVRDLNTMAELYVQLHPEIVREDVRDGMSS